MCDCLHPFPFRKLKYNWIFFRTLYLQCSCIKKSMLSLKDFCPKNNMNADDINGIKLHPPVKRCRLLRPIKRFLQPKIAVTKDLHCSKVPYNSSLFQAFRSWGQRSLRASSPFGGYREKKTRERHARGGGWGGGGVETKKSLQRLT